MKHSSIARRALLEHQIDLAADVIAYADRGYSVSIAGERYQPGDARRIVRSMVVKIRRELDRLERLGVVESGTLLPAGLAQFEHALDEVAA